MLRVRCGRSPVVGFEAARQGDRSKAFSDTIGSSRRETRFHHTERGRSLA
ncbi:hypothetical protein [Baaleninema simplex]|nr:hypothetical protein [Baaleninema simplex]